MPTVNFTMRDIYERPMAFRTFTISAGYPDTGYVPGDPVPVPVNATTDDLGRFSLELVATPAPYYITLTGTKTSTFTAYKFFVPETSASVLEADMLYVDLGTQLKLLNDASLAALIEAKVSVFNHMALYGPSLLAYLETMSQTIQDGVQRVPEHTVVDGDIAVEDDAYGRRMVYKGSTTNATPTILTRDDGTAVVVAPANSVSGFHLMITGVNTGTLEGASYLVTGCIMRDASVDSTVLVGTPTLTVLGETDATWTVGVDADTVLGGLKILVTGAAGKTIKWSAVVDVGVVKQ